jgi:hypothetical protein
MLHSSACQAEVQEHLEKLQADERIRCRTDHCTNSLSVNVFGFNLPMQTRGLLNFSVMRSSQWQATCGKIP